jgi:hypothetical protein
MNLYSIPVSEGMMREIAQQRRGSGGRVLGFPLEGFSLFQSLLLAAASAFFTFFAVTCVAIFSLMAWNILGGHSVNYADTYLYAGFPAGILVLLVALPYFLVLWIRAKVRR